MNHQLSRSALVVASILAAGLLTACASTETPSDTQVAKGPPPDCPIGTHICRRDSSAGPTDSVSAEELRRQGQTGVGGMRPGQMSRPGGGG